MTPEPEADDKRRWRKLQNLSLIAVWLTISSVAIVVLRPLGYEVNTRNIFISLFWPLALVLAYWFLERTVFQKIFQAIRRKLGDFFTERAPALLYRMCRTVEGSSKIDFGVDLGRLASILGVVFIPIWTHGTAVFSSGYGPVYGLSSAVLILTLLAPYLRGKTIWDDAFNFRKARMATAINYASAFLNDPQQRSAIRHMESNVLLAIKSYLEYSVLETNSHNFAVNLIVKNPRNPQQLVCINRATAGEVPKFYSVGSLAVAMEAMEKRVPLYNGRFKSKLIPPKPFKTIWQVPICSSSNDDEARCIGLLAIDSRRPRHLDVQDRREALLFNLAPYIAILRHALMLRAQHDYWE